MESITSEQIKRLIQIVKKASGPSAEKALEELRDSGELGQEGLQLVLKKSDQLPPHLVSLFKAVIMEMANNIQGCMKRILEKEIITIPKTSGKENLVHAKDVFTGWIDPNFEAYGCDVESKPTHEAIVEVFELIEECDFGQIFGGFNMSLDKLCLTQHQIKLFVKSHRNKLRVGGFGTFFMFKAGEEYFVAHVNFSSDGRLKVRAYRYSNNHMWHAENRHRLIVPQLKG